MKYTDIKNELLSNSQVKTEYDKLTPEYELVRATLNARLMAKMSQQELAEKIGINRSDISKLENGKSNPSYKMLCRLAKGMGMKLKIEFVPDSE